jgi:transcriptional regulator with XRE-family HTH domain
MTPMAAERKLIKAHEKALADTMTQEEVIALIKATQGDKSLREYAKEIGVTAPYINDIYQGRRSPGPAILQYFGLGKRRRAVVEYVFFKTK